MEHLEQLCRNFYRDGTGKLLKVTETGKKLKDGTEELKIEVVAMKVPIIKSINQNKENGDITYILEVETTLCKKVEIAISGSDLFNPTKAKEILGTKGLYIESTIREFFINYLEEQLHQIEQIALFEGVGTADKDNEFRIVHPQLLKNEGFDLEEGFEEDLKYFQIPKGASAEKWRAEWEKVRINKNVEFGAIFQVASLFLRKCNIEGCWLAFNSTSNTGKSAQCKILNTMFFNQDDLYNWDCSEDWFYKICSFFNGFTIVIDETSKFPEEGKSIKFTRMIYALIAGMASLRGNVTGKRKTKTFRLNAIITGENSIMEKCTKTGALSRIIQINDGHIKETIPKQNELKRIIRKMEQNAVVVGMEIVKAYNELIVNTDEFEKYFGEHLEIALEKYENLAEPINSKNLDKLVDRFALMECVANWLQDKGLLHIEPKTVEDIFHKISTETTGYHIQEQKLELMLEEIQTKIDYKVYFMDERCHNILKGEPYAIVDNKGRVYLLVTYLRKKLDFQYESEIKEMLEKGLLIGNEKGEFFNKRAGKEKRHRCFQVSPNLLDKLNIHFKFSTYQEEIDFMDI